MSVPAQDQINQLRSRAEALLSEMGKTGTDELSISDMSSVIHDLSVHQIELEMQNEELQKIQRDLLQTQEEYHDLYHHVPVGYLTLDRHGMILKHNQTFSSMLENAGQKFTGTPFTNFILSEDQGIFLARYKAFLKSPKEKNIDLRLIRQDGGLLWVRLTGQLGPSSSGHEEELSSLLMTVADITWEKVAEEEKRRAERQKHQMQKLKSLGTLAGGVAHNFNNSLAIIIGNLEMALLKLPQDSKVAEKLRYAKIAAKGSCELIKSILTFSHPETVDKAPILIVPVFEETLSLLQSTIPSTVELIFNLPAERQVLTIAANPSQIQEALLNLCSNAVDAMNEKGTLTLSLNRVELHLSDIPSHNDCPPGPYVLLRVEDTGCGMTKKTMENIFDPFFTTKDVGKGTGLGLSTVHGIVEKHQGLLKVQSTPNRGTRIEMYYPLKEQTQPESMAGLMDEAEHLPHGHEKILVVDDNEMLAQTIKAMLSARGYEVTKLTSSIKALAAIQKNPEQFDLVITDQTMPGLTGKDFVQLLKKIRPDLPAVLCTGYSSKISDKEADQLGINAYFIKPVELKKLLVTVRRLLDEKS